MPLYSSSIAPGLWGKRNVRNEDPYRPGIRLDHVSRLQNPGTEGKLCFLRRNPCSGKLYFPAAILPVGDYVLKRE